MPTETQLSEVLSEFARTMVTDFPIQAILDHLVQRIVDVLPVSAAGVTLIEPGTEPRYVAASDESALRYERLQSELGEGPCLEAHRTGNAVAVPDLRLETRFPRFAPRAIEEGLVAVFTFSLRNGTKSLGALDLYRSTPGPLDAATMAAAQTLADVAAAYLLNAQARTDLQDSTDRAREISLHDPLTGLPNRVLLLVRLDHAVARGRRSGSFAAVLFADLDRFKVVNDRHGHGTGDDLLLAVAHRLTALMRPGDTLARLSGDEFVVLCEELHDPAEVDEIAARITAAVAAPFDLGGTTITISASVGIAFSGRTEQLSEQILQDADTAMYQAKRKGGGLHQVMDLRERQQDAERASLEHDLHGALGRGELHLEYQQIVETATGATVGAEALLRWTHPARGNVPPLLFIPLAEHAGLITDIGRWVLEQACTDRHRWQDDQAPRRFTMAVNVSAHELMAPHFAGQVAAVLAATATDPGAVVLEVTESVFIGDSERALLVLCDLREQGLRLALDDFGTGYASLNYLKQFPIDVVKVDRSFVTDVASNPASRAIVAAVIDLAHVLGKSVVAEGVETAGQHEQLAELDCDHCQGYYFGLPLRADALDVALRDPRPPTRPLPRQR